MKTVRFSIPLL